MALVWRRGLLPTKEERLEGEAEGAAASPKGPSPGVPGAEDDEEGDIPRPLTMEAAAELSESCDPGEEK